MKETEDTLAVRMSTETAPSLGWKYFIGILAMVAPGRVRRFLHTRVLGYEIDGSASIGRALVVVDQLRMGPGSHIAHLSVIRGCTSVELGARASIGPLVWVNGIRPGKAYPGVVRSPVLVLRDGAAVTSMHLLDCSDRIEIGPFSTIAGWGSQLLTHSIDIAEGRQRTSSLYVGERVFIGTRCVVLAGVRVPDRVVVGAGSVLHRSPEHGLALYAGNPARFVRDLDPDAKYFTRTDPFVH